MSKPTRREQMAYATIAKMEAEIAELKARAGGWIKCSDKLPPLAQGDNECSDNVLVYEVDLGARMLQAFYSRDDELWYDQRGDQLDGEVTHWQPLPTPPTE